MPHALPTNKRSPQTRYLLATLVLIMAWAASCSNTFAPASEIRSLRILALTTDKPYANAGDSITLSMTVHDGLEDADDPDAGPRALQIMWLAGCYDPEGDLYFLCFAQLAEQLGALAGASSDNPPDTSLLKITTAAPTSSGVPNAHEFTFTLPDDIVTRRPVPEEGPHYGIAYVFFAACAGTLAPAPLDSLGGQAPEFPVQCLDDQGQALGADSFVPGYTQIYAFADERANSNPAISGLLLDGESMSDNIDEVAVVAACPLSEEERRVAGCGSKATTDGCTAVKLEAEIGDEAENDPDAFGKDGAALRETVWVSYFSDGGDLDPAIALVSDATEGYIDDHSTSWLPPAEPGLYQLWAVARDQRGGSSVIRRFVRVE